MFLHLSVSHSVHRGRVPGQVHPPLGPSTPPGPGTPPRPGTPRDQVHPPLREQCMTGDTGNKRAVRILLECILVTFHFANHMRTLADYSNTALPEDKQLCQNSEVLHVKSLRAVYLAPKSHVYVPFTEHFQCAMFAFCHKRLNVCRIRNMMKPVSVIMSPSIGYFAFVTYSHRHLQQVLYINNVNGLCLPESNVPF